MKRQTALLVAVTLFATGFVRSYAPRNLADGAEPLPPGKIRFTPIDLFPEDLKRLQPHLEMEGACFKFEYEGPKQSACIVLQILERGKREVRSTLFLNPLDGRSSGEVSVSIRTIDESRGPPAWHIVAHVMQIEGKGASRSTQTVIKTIPAKATSSTGKSIEAVADCNINEETVLWCKLRGGRPIPAEVSVEELAAAADTAVVLKLVPGGAE
jgi:hypothetical protein